MAKVYVVTSEGGDWDIWTNIEGICSTKEKAEKLRKEIEDQYIPPISQDKFSEMLCELDKYMEENNTEFDNDIEGLMQLFPEYTKEDLEKSESIYNYSDFKNVYITEMDLL